MKEQFSPFMDTIKGILEHKKQGSVFKIRLLSLFYIREPSLILQFEKFLEALND
jgi:hypothetical protein